MTQQQLRQETIKIRHILDREIETRIWALEFASCSRESQAFQACYPCASKGVEGFMHVQYGKEILYSAATHRIEIGPDDGVKHFNPTLRDTEIKKRLQV